MNLSWKHKFILYCAIIVTIKSAATIPSASKKGLVVNMEWRWARNEEVGFIDEYMRMSKYGFDFYDRINNPNGILYNKILSPGSKIFGRWFQ